MVIIVSGKNCQSYEKNDLSIFAYSYISNVAENYSVRNFKKKFFFLKSLEYDNGNIILKKLKKCMTIKINDINFYSFSYSYKINMLSLTLVLKDAYISFDLSSCIEYEYLILNLFKNNLQFKTYSDTYSYLEKEDLKRITF